MNYVVQIPFYMDSSKMLDYCILLQHLLPHIQFIIQANLETFPTNLSSCSASSI